jgi:hypothetical protein
MRALKKTRKLIERNPGKPAAKILSALVVALESEEPFKLADLYQLDYDNFGLALELLAEWRLDRYYSSKAVLLDISMQLGRLQEEQKQNAPAADGTAAQA